MTKFSRFGSMVLVLAAVLCAGCWTTVDPGEVGVAVRFGTMNPDVQPPGLYVAVLTSVHEMSTRTQTYTMVGAGAEGLANGSVNVLARDQLPVLLDVSVMFHLNGTRAVDVFRVFGEKYDDNVVHPLVRTAVRDAASEFTAMDLVDNRTALQARMSELVRGQLASTLRGRHVDGDAVVIDNILIRNIDLPQSIDEAIAAVQRQRQATAASVQANLTAQQEAARALTSANGDAAALIARTHADAEMLRIRTESQALAMRTSAEAQAEANRVLSGSLTPAFLAYERIQATRAVLSSPTTRTVFLPSGMSPNMLMSAP